MAIQIDVRNNIVSRIKNHYWEEINQRAYEEEITGLRQPEAHYALEEAHKYYSKENKNEMSRMQCESKRLGT